MFCDGNGLHFDTAELNVMNAFENDSDIAFL
jgi:hypothetical protein